MGFRTERESSSGRDQAGSAWGRDDYQSSTWAHESDQSSTPQPQFSAADCEELFGLDVYRDGVEVTVQRLVESHGAGQVRQWADEGMPVETMGEPRSMDAFRERQAERPADVPRDIERRNAMSVQRSRDAHHEPSRAGDAGVPESVRDVVSSPGRRLDSDIQGAIEERMGDSLGDVRIHTGPQAVSACEDINARAFTVGNHVAFNAGEYDPESPEGQHVLAHELAHVRQQTGGAVSMLPQSGGLEIDPDERLEREAEETAQRVMQGGELGVYRMASTDVHLQRMSADEYIQGDSIEGMIEAIASQSELSDEEVASIVENYKQTGTAYGGSKGHDALNLKALKEAQKLLESTDLMAGIDEELLAELADGDLRIDTQVASEKWSQDELDGRGMEHFDHPREAFETHRELEANKEKLEQRAERLDQQLEATVGGSNIRLTDAQAEQLQSLADQIDSPYTQDAVDILLNYLSVEATGLTLSSAIATAASASQMSGVIVAVGVVSTVATLLPHAISLLEGRLESSTDDDNADSASEKVDF